MNLSFLHLLLTISKWCIC